MPPPTLPIDMNNSEVRNYLSLIRLQVLTPLSLLISTASLLVCQFMADPSIRRIFHLYPASISPKPGVIAPYVALIFVAQIGYCVLLVSARKEETKDALVKGVGLSLVFANWVIAGWAIAWIFRWFLLSAILQGILVLLLVYSNINLLVYHAPTWQRPLDMLLIHAPLRFFLILPLSLMFPYSLFIKLGLTYTPTAPGIPIDYDKYPWSGFGVVFGSNLLGLAVIMLRRDFIWCVAATWVCVSIWSARPKPAPVYITVLVFTIIHPLALVAAVVHHRFLRRRRVALENDDEALHRPHSIPPNGEQPPNYQATAQQPREVDPEQLWG
ncbi:hypothetical protein HGRIS_012454 [Hohenbuehelia grisea]|uniref:Uncharacterized protein n=1 Tax=Hohenbuehelia grisea TaxID=104357 RepID=A0ABR3ISD6_9AGAR